MLAGLTVSVRVRLFVCAVVEESVTVNVSGVPCAVPLGVPEIAPLLDKARPAGSTPPVSVQTSGALPPVALNVAMYACPAHPFWSEVVVMLRAAPGGGADGLPGSGVGVDDLPQL